MAKTREESIDLIEEGLDAIDEKDLLTIANDYNEANSYPHYYRNNEDTLTELLNDSLTNYFEYMRHSEETYDKDDDYVYINGNGWLTSFDWLYDELDTRAVAEFVYEHFDDYDSMFKYIVDLDEEDEEEEE